MDRNMEAYPRIYETARNVATREGGVDRNFTEDFLNARRAESPPARVAWIETFNEQNKNKQAERRHPRGWRG